MREAVGYEHSAGPETGGRSSAILKTGSPRSTSQSLPSGIAVGIAGHNRQHAKPQDLIERMANLPRLLRILQASRQPAPKVQASFDILEQQEAAIGGRAPVVDQG